jgi:hypothetical protein
MTYYGSCVAAGNRMIPYDAKARGQEKPETVRSLQVDDPDADFEFEGPKKKIQIPKHEPGASKEWNATDCARSLLARYDRLVAGRSEEERREVLTAFNEMAEDSNRELEESQRLMRQGGKMLDDSDGGILK